MDNLHDEMAHSRLRDAVPSEDLHGIVGRIKSFRAASRDWGKLT
jgi:hypothetical protein